MRLSLQASLVGNLTLFAFILGQRPRLKRLSYAALAEQRFAGITPGRVTIVGDSQVDLAPLADLVSDWRQLGVSGATLGDVRAWVHRVNSPEVVIMAGSNDEVRGLSVDRSADDLNAMLEQLAGKVCSVVSVPPILGRNVSPRNAAMRAVAERHATRWVDLGPMAEFEWTFDGLHLNRAAYVWLLNQLTRV